jgi:hypothetical protein
MLRDVVSTVAITAMRVALCGGVLINGVRWARVLARAESQNRFQSSQRARHAMTPLPAGDAFFTVAIMSATFLTEVALFILIGII